MNRRLFSGSPQWIAAGIALLVLGACATDRGGAETADSAPPAAEVAAPPTLRAGGLTLRPITSSPQYPGAALALMMPAAGEELAAGNNIFHFEVTGFDLGAQTTDAEGKGLANSGDGQHIHFILDNGAYSALYSPHFETELTPGNHVVLGFLSRSYHESVKSPGAAVLRNVKVAGSDEGVVADLAAPHLFFSRPKGVYKGGDATSLMLDFYLVNAELSPDGYKVRAHINGNEFLIDHWVPYAIEGLPLGEVTIELELVDAVGNPVPGPFNRVARTATLAAADGAAAH